LVKDKDLKLISGSFLENEIYQEKNWLKRYFSSFLQISFLSYFLCFRSHFYFNQHTGIVCSKRYLKKMKKKLCLLESIYEKARSNFDLELLEKIEKGKYKL
jgi:hypothetical protein